MSAPVLAARFFARVASSKKFGPRNSYPDPQAGLFCFLRRWIAAPGLHVVLSGLRNSLPAAKGSGTPKDAFIKLPHPSMRLRALQSALAFRRSTAALAKGTFVPKAQRQARLPGTRPERSILYGRPNRGAETLRRYTGVTRADLSQSSEAPRAPVVVPAGMMPEPPENAADEAAPAGTALAPIDRRHRPTSFTNDERGLSPHVT